MLSLLELLPFKDQSTWSDWMYRQTRLLKEWWLWRVFKIFLNDHLIWITLILLGECSFLGFRDGNAVLSMMLFVYSCDIIWWAISCSCCLFAAIKRLTGRLFIVNSCVPDLAIDVRNVHLYCTCWLRAYVPLFLLLLYVPLSTSHELIDLFVFLEQLSSDIFLLALSLLLLLITKLWLWHLLHSFMLYLILLHCDSVIDILSLCNFLWR